MRLGTETGSVINHLYSRATRGQPEPEVGMGATILGWTDRYAGTIARIFNVGKSTYIEVRYDRVERVDGNGLSEQQTYRCQPDPEGAAIFFRLRPGQSRWEFAYYSHVADRWYGRKSGLGVRIGCRDPYRDPSF